MTLAISAKSKRLKSQGYDVIGFGAGEPDFDTPEYIKQAARKALDDGFTKYTPASGTDSLKQEICKKFARDNNLEYETDNILVSCGAKHSLYNTFQALLNPGDEVIIPRPYWVSYPEMVKMGDGQPVYVDVNEENKFRMTPENFKEKISPKTRALILNTPSNPHGAVYRKTEIEKIAEIALDNDIIIVSDEVYEYLVYDGMEHYSTAALSPEVKEQTITINAMSKSYAMTGWRVGYAAGNKKLIKAMSNIQSHSTSNPNSIAQKASTAALKETQKARQAIQKMYEAFDDRRKFMYREINDSELLSSVLPEGAFYTLMNISKIIGMSYKGEEIKGSLDFADALLDAQQVAVVPGIAFGADQFVRLSYASSIENIEQGLRRIKKFADGL